MSVSRTFVYFTFRLKFRDDEIKFDFGKRIFQKILFFVQNQISWLFPCHAFGISNIYL